MRIISSYYRLDALRHGRRERRMGRRQQGQREGGLDASHEVVDLLVVSRCGAADALRYQCLGLPIDRDADALRCQCHPLQ
jgi:hypothetical protein